MKKLILVIALGFAAILSAPAQAASDSATVNVNITLNSKCIFSSVADVAFTYTAFTGITSSTPGSFNMKCTNGLGYKVGFDSTATPATTENVTDDKVNIAYTLTLGGTAAATGDGTNKSFTVTPTATATQSGTCAVAGGVCTNTTGSTTKVRTVYVVY
jgi:spore coat protein U-like protein